MNKDLTVGNPSTVLWKFCLPMFGSVVFQQLYNIADSLVAGKFVGEAALAAVGNSYEITLIFIAFAFGCNIGCSVIVSRFFGAKQYRDMKTAVTTSLIGCAALVALLMLVGLAGCDALLELINTPEEILADSALYLDIYVLGLPFMFFYNVATGIFSALGDSKTPFFFLAASSVSNIFMDILFVTAFDMGVAGVAWATFLCQGVSCVLAVWAVARRMQGIPTPEKPALFSWRMLGKIAVIAVPSILQQSSVSVGNIIIQSVINSFGASVIAGYSAAVKLNNLVITSFTTLANGISNYTSQNLGAAKPERCAPGLSRRRQTGLADLRAPGGRLLLCGAAAALPVHERAHRHRHRDRHPLFADRGPLLLRGVPQAGVGRGAAGLLADGPVHGGHLCRPDPAGGPVGGAVRHQPGLHRHLAVLAHRLGQSAPGCPSCSACGPWAAPGPSKPGRSPFRPPPPGRKPDRAASGRTFLSRKFTGEIC